MVRGRIDDGDKGRLVLAEDVRLLELALDAGARPRAAGGEPGACRIRIVADADAEARLAALRKMCETHPGGVAVFVHLVLAGQEVVVRSRGCSVDPTPDRRSAHRRRSVWAGVTGRIGRLADAEVLARESSASVFLPFSKCWTTPRLNSTANTRRPSAFRGNSPMRASGPAVAG